MEMKKNLYRMLVATVLLMGMNMVALAQSFKSNGHNYTMKGTLTIKSYNPNATGQVTFTNVPSNYEVTARRVRSASDSSTTLPT